MQERIDIVDIVVKEGSKVTVIDLGDVPNEVYETIEIEPIRQRDLSHQPFASAPTNLNESGGERPQRDTS